MNRQQACIKQTARGNNPEQTRATEEVQREFTRPVTGLHYRKQLNFKLTRMKHNASGLDS